MADDPYNSIREDLVDLVKQFHAANYPAMEVNYPKQFITDVEHAVDPFSTVEISARTRKVALGNTCFEVKGKLILNLFAKTNSGSKIFAEYTDKLFEFFAGKTLNLILFGEVNPYSNKLIPGFDGEMNTISFERDYFKQ